MKTAIAHRDRPGFVPREPSARYIAGLLLKPYADMDEPQAPKGEELFTLMTWNVNGLLPTLPNLSLSQHKGLAGFFKNHQLDAVCLQELKTPEARMTAEMACVPGFESFWAVSRERQGYSGVTTWLRGPPYCPQQACVDDVGSATGAGEDLDREGRCVITDLGDFVLCNVYVPNAGDRPARPRLDFKCRFLESLKTRVCQFMHQGKEVVLVGDFNVPAERRDMHTTYNYAEIYHTRELQLLHSFTSELVDVWRHLHPEAEDCYTVWEERTNARAFNAGSRIDYVLASPGLLDRVASCEICYDMPPKWSDHAPVVLKLKGVTGLGPRPPCELSSRRMKRFQQPGRSIADMFSQAARKRPRLEEGAAAASNSLQGATSTDQGAEPAGQSNGEPGAGAAQGAGDAIQPAASQGAGGRSSNAAQLMSAESQKPTQQDNSAQQASSQQGDGTQQLVSCPAGTTSEQPLNPPVAAGNAPPAGQAPAAKAVKVKAKGKAASGQAIADQQRSITSFFKKQ